MRRSLGFKLHYAGRGLLDFVSFMEKHHAYYITQALALAWAQQPSNVQPAHWASRLSFIRCFAQYRSATDPRTQIPAKGLLPFQPKRARPYLYSDAEIRELLSAALNMPYWYERGKLRVLRSDDRDDFAFEYAPEYGKMLMFRVCDHSWHGFLPQKGKRASLQLCYVDSDWYVKREYWRHSLSAYAKSVPLLNKMIDFAPRRFFAK